MPKVRIHRPENILLGVEVAEGTAMNQNICQNHPEIISFPLRMVLYIVIVLIMININALVDMFLHPDIPYFDEEHLIVGFTGGITVVIMIVILESYFRHLSKALQKIMILESFLSICSYCNKIKIPGAAPERRESWISIESYISEKTQTKFSHGICLDCLAKNFPDIHIENKPMNRPGT